MMHPHAPLMGSTPMCENDGSGKPADRDNPDYALAGAYRKMYHKGFGNDDVDRYGPVLELVKDLHRRIEAASLAGAR